jgi:hypothetical protein
MPETKPKRVRPRPCYLQVELTRDESNCLDAIVTGWEASGGLRWNRAAVVRELIIQAKRALKAPRG